MIDHREAIAREADSLRVAARASGLDASVPSCPGWDVHELVRHAGTTHRWATTLVETRATGYVAADLGDLPEERDAIFGWFGDGAERLVHVLGATDPDASVWSWAADHDARFWARRMAHETTVHRWDAQTAGAGTQPIDGELATDGVDEQLANIPYMLAFRPKIAGLTGSGETIHLHATDRDGEWLIRLTPDGIESERGHAKGDVAARGPASDLFLFLVGRIPPSRLEVFGDAPLLDRWQREFKF